MHQESLAVYEALEDSDSIANTFWSIAQIEMQQQKWPEAFEHLCRSSAINLNLGRLDGICMVGLDLGQILCAGGQREEGLQILARCRDGFRRLAWPGYPERVQKITDQITDGGETWPPSRQRRE